MLFSGADFVSAATKTWTGATSNVWTLDGNWNEGTAPTSIDDVIIDGNGPNAPLLDLAGAEVTIASLSLGNSSTSVLTLSNANTSTAKLTITNDLTVGASGTLQHTANSSSQTHVVNLNVGGDLTINAGGIVSATGRGFSGNGGFGAGISAGNSGSGAGHGGNGGNSSQVAAPGGITYGSTTRPFLIGSGGGAGISGSGGAGGGLVLVNVTGTSTVNGQILANGNNGTGDRSGGGSGGSINITTNVLEGSGTIAANGGEAINASGGAGAGGRIAIFFTTNTYTGTTTAYGGSITGTQKGAAGTIFTKASSATYGDLLVKNNNVAGANTTASTTAVYDNISVQNAGQYVIASSTTVTLASSSITGTTNAGLTVNYGGTLSGASFATCTSTNITNYGVSSIASSFTIGGNCVWTENATTSTTFTNLTVGSGGTLTHVASGLPLTMTMNSLTVDAGGTVSISGRGYGGNGGVGSGVSASNSGGGGGYGGDGGNSDQAPARGGYTYGSTTLPTLFGSGGALGLSGAGGAGGGAGRFTVAATTTVNGQILANGSNGTGQRSGGGAGGSVLITTGILAGSGTIAANGGNAIDGQGGAGAGGRIALYYTTNTYTGTTTAYGGGTTGAQKGGAGTIYMKGPSGTYGNLILKNNNVAGAYTTASTSASFDNISITDAAQLRVATGTTVTLASTSLPGTTNAGLTVDGGATLSAASLSNCASISITNNGSFVLPSAFSIGSNCTWVENATSSTTFTDLTVASGGTLTHTANPGAQYYRINTSLSNLTVDAGGLVSVSGRGYPGNSGTGAGTSASNSGGGGGHGGNGGNSNQVPAPGGVSYGSTTRPTTLGSGGAVGLSGAGGTGGGAIELTVSGTTTVNGQILAAGNNGSGSRSGGGAGGSIFITTGGLAGNGTIAANGGNAIDSQGGAGAGGRVALEYTNYTYTGTTTAYGGGTTGAEKGGAGTIFTKSATSTYGNLLVHNNNVTGADTKASTTLRFDTITVQNAAKYNIASSSNASTTNLTIGSGSTFTAPTLLTISGNYTNNGTFTHNGGTLYFSSTSAQTISGSMTGSSPFATTTFIGSGTKTFSNNASTTSHFNIESGATVVAPAFLTVGGNYTNNGNFTDSSGTVFFSSNTNQTISGTLNTSATDFANTEFLGSGTKTISSNASTTNLTVGSGATVVAPLSLSVSGNFSNNGTFTPSNKFLLHADGTGNSFTDSALSKTITAIGNVTQSSTQSKFGGKSAFFDGSGDSLSLADSDDWNYGSGDFTIDFWFRPSSVSAGQHILYVQGNVGNYAPVNLQRNGSSLNLYMSSTGSSWDVANGAVVGTLSADTWYHFALTRSGSNIRYFLDGSLVNTIVSSATLLNSADPVYLGGSNSDQYWDGYIDEIRIVKGIAYWTSAFTPPTSAYANGDTMYISGTSQQTLSGTMTGGSAFSNLRITNSSASTTISSALTATNLSLTTPGAKVELPASATTTVSSLTITGSSGNEVWLRSTTPGTKAGLSITGTYAITYANVKDSSGTTTGGDILADDGTSIDSGNNNGWDFILGDTKTWTGATSNVWTLDGNWSGNSAPTSVDDVIIDGNGPNAPLLDLAGAEVTIDSLTLGNSSTSILTLSNANTSTAKLTISNDLTIGGSGTIQHTSNTTTQTHVVNLSVGGNLTIDAGGKIDVGARGYTAGSGGGAGVTPGGSSGGGAGYGGEGGDGSNTGAYGGITYGSSTAPLIIGSGGATGLSGSGGAGGGLALLNVTGTTTVNGQVLATGANGTGSRSGGGSGGAIHLTTGTLTGAGTIAANGGNAVDSLGGAAGGGRIALYYTTNSYTGTTTAYGGGTTGNQKGGAGTIFTKSTSATYGDLLVKNNNIVGRNTTASTSGSFANISVRDAAQYVIASGTTMTFASSSIIGTTNAGLTVNGTLSATSLSNCTSTVLSNTGTVTVASSFTIGNNCTWNENATSSNTFSDLTIASGGILSHSANPAAQYYRISTSLANITIDVGGKVDVGGRGYAAGSGIGAGVNPGGSGGGGGGHGGEGGDGSNTGVEGGIAYGSTTLPISIGSGGATGLSGSGGAGGGAVQLTVSGTTTINGQFLATGANGTGSRSGGGAGGSILINTVGLTGSGTIAANGGSASDGLGGAAGGGHIALLYTNYAYTGTTTAYGGAVNGFQKGGAGTIFTKSATSTFGNLLVDNNGTAGVNTTATTTLRFDTITVQNAAKYYIASSSNASTTNFTIGSGSTFTAPELLSISGNYSNTGTFTPRSGTTTLSGTSQQTLSGTMTGSSAFANLTITNTSGAGSSSQSILFSAAASTTGTLTMNASTSARFLASASTTFQNIALNGAAGQYVWLRSSNSGTRYSFYVPGTKSLTYVNVQDNSACPGSITVDASTSVDAGNNNCWTFAAPLTFSGTLYSDEGFTAITTGKTIGVAVGTSTVSRHTTTTNGSGAWTLNLGINHAVVPSTPILAWVDGDAATPASVFTKASSSVNNISQLDLYKRRVIIKHEGFTGTTTTNDNLGFYDGDDDSDIPYAVNGTGDYIQKKEMELHIAPGTVFEPVGDVTLRGNASTSDPDGDFHLAYGLRQDGVATTSQALMGDASLILAGNFLASSSSLYSSTNYTTFTSTSSAQKRIIATSSPFYFVNFVGSGSWTFGTHAATSTEIDVQSGTLTAPSSNLTLMGALYRTGTFNHNNGTTTFYNTSGNNSIAGDMTGTNAFNNVVFRGAGAKSFGSNAASTTNFTIESSSGAVTAPSSYLSISGNYTNNGTFTHNNGTVYFSSTSAQSISGTMTGSSAFATTTFIGSSTKSFTNNASTTNHFNIDSGATVVAPAYLSIGGNYTNSGTFTHNSGTTTLSSSTQQTLSGNMTGTSAFSNLVIANTSGAGSSSQSVIFGTAASTTDTFTMLASTSVSFLANASSTFQNISLKGAVGQYVWLRSSSPGTRYSFYVPGIQKQVTYVDVQDSSACPGSISTSNITSADSGNNNCWFFGNIVVAASSAENQIFSYGQATTSISTITLTDAATPTITATNDIRLVIATTSANMRWDTTDTTAIFGGTASGKVSNPVSYLGGGQILVVPVDTNFASNDTLTIGGLSYSQFASATAPVNAIGVRTTGAGTTTDATDDKTIGITGTLTLSDHSGGQVNDSFDFTNQTETELLAFRLAPQAETSTVSALTIPLSGVFGLQAGDITNVALYRDLNSNKTYDAGETAVGGSGTVVINGQTGSITFGSSFNSTTTQDYLLVGDLSSITGRDSTYLSLSASGVIASGLTSGLSITPTGSVSSVFHRKGSAGGGGQGSEIGGAPPAGQGTQTGGGSGGGGEIDPNTGDTIGNEPGFKAPTQSGTPLNNWTNGSNGLSSDGNYATAASSLSQSYGNFGFNVPGNNTIAGIGVKLEASATTNAGTISVRLSWDGGSSVTSLLTTGTVSTTDAVYELGGPSNTWGRAWTPGETANGTFTIEVIANPSGNTISLDAVQVNIYHQATGGGQGGGGAVYKGQTQFYANAYTAAGDLYERFLEWLFGWTLK